LKYLIVLGIIALIFYLILFWRLRHYLPVARRIFGITRDIYRMTKSKEGARPVERSTRGVGERLVRCAACGTWIPASGVIRLKSATYCSTSCLENASVQPRPTRRSAKG
jgi:hypothetical protein